MSYTLTEIVKEWIVENGKNDSQEARFYTIALSGLRELNMDVNGIVKIVELCINDNDTVDLPCDYLKYSRIGISGTDGRIHVLGMDNSINLLPNSSSYARRSSDDAYTYPFMGYPYSGFFYGVNGFVGGMFGLGGGTNEFGYYRIDKGTNQIYLAGMSANNQCSIVLEYIADVNASEGDFIVHPYIIQTVKDYISWKYVNNDRNTNLGEKQFKRKEFYNSLRMAKKRYAALTPEEWAIELRKTNTASVRF